jgi:hypothetical protein
MRRFMIADDSAVICKVVGIAQHVAAAPDGFDVVVAAGRFATASCAACR